MTGWLLVGVAWAGRWDGEPTDVEVSRVVPGSAAGVHAQLADHAAWAELVPETCASEWELQARTTGVGARARVRWTLGPMRRRLTVVIRKDQPGQLLELEHEGDKGWFTQVRYAAAGEGQVEVTLSTPLTSPPWPVRGVFHRRVRPAWEACYADVLAALPR